MVYFVAFMSVLICAWATRLAVDPPLLDMPDIKAIYVRAAKILLPYFGVLAGVSVYFAVLSWPYTRTILDEPTIAQLRALEAALPRYAMFAKDWVPPWFAMAIVAASMIAITITVPKPDREQVSGLSFLKKVVQLLRKYATVTTLISTVLTLACVFTLFGDGLEDRDSDVRAQIHEAKLRFNNGIDEKVREFGAAIAEETVQALVHGPNAANRYARAALALQLELTEAAKRFRYSRQDPYWQERSTALDAVTKIRETRLPEKDAEQKRLKKEDIPAAAKSIQVEVDISNLTPRQINNIGSLHHSAKENQQELAAELVAGALERFQQLLGAEPWLEFFYSVIAEALKDTLSRALDKQVIEPALQKFVNTGASSSGAFREHARDIVRQTDIVKYGRQLNDRYGEQLTKVASTFESARDILAATADSSPALTDISNHTPLPGKDRDRLITCLKRLNMTEISKSLERMYVKVSEDRTNVQLIQDVAQAERLAFIAFFNYDISDRYSLDHFTKEYFQSLAHSAHSKSVRSEIPSTYREPMKIERSPISKPPIPSRPPIHVGR